MHLRTTKRIRQEVMLYDPIGADREGNEISLMDILSSDEDEVLDEVVLNIDRNLLSQCLAVCPSENGLCLNFGLGWGAGTYDPAPNRPDAGYFRSYVSRIEKRALGKLLNAMGL